jgi:ribosomal protein S18 acetylase RimI-like enzyme
MKLSPHNHFRIDDWITQIKIRPVRYSDLPSMEWEGAYTHFRKVYQRTYQKACEGKTLMWVVDLQTIGVIAQVFVQLESPRKDLADGKNVAYLYAFRVRPAYRNQGLGKKMLTFVEDEMQQRGFREITLNVAQRNEPAIRLYQQVGYQIVGYEKGDWTFHDHQNRLRRIIEPAWKMIKRLDGN